MPRIGLGVYQSKEGREVKQAIAYALAAGYRHIDTAKIYGNEEGVGEAVHASGIPREDIFITTKLWNSDQGYDSALRAIDGSLARLSVEYVDLYLIHWPFTGSVVRGNKREETWKAMEEIYKAGKAKAIGVSNYTIKHLEEMRTYATVEPAVNQVEFHPFLYQKELLEYCEGRDIALEAYSPLMQGKHLMDEHISAIAQTYNKTNAQVLIRWSLQHGCIVIPKSVHKERIEENIDVFDFELKDADMRALDALNADHRVSWDPTDS